MQMDFEAELWVWDARRADTWVFLTLPADLSETLREETPPGPGFGSVRVEVTLGSSTWRTSVFPDSESGCYVLPVKKAVRTKERIGPGDSAQVHLRAL
ncbi:MAG: DUF1905 domain-containing protein [Actinobacteria bacterium]|nr:DUF1905 domain-containing protein [Actinomycetota bacterium]